MPARHTDMSGFKRRCYILRIKAFGATQPGMPDYFHHVRGLMPLEILLGQQGDCAPLVYWRPGREINGTFLVLGASGSGKTETLKRIGKEIAEHAIPVIVLDFHGDVSFPGVNTVLLSSGSFSTIGINPLELDCHDDGFVGLYEQRAIFLEMLQRVVRLGHKQKSVLNEVIHECYREFGIHDEYPEIWGNTPPTLTNVLSMLHHRASDKGVLANDRNVITGCISAVRSVLGHPIFQRRNYVSTDDILRGNLRIDLSKINSEGVRHIVAETLLWKIFRVLKLQGKIPDNPVDDSERFRIFIIIDEAKILGMVGGDVNDSRLILNILATEGRKYGIGLILASQLSEHFGHEIKANASTWLVMKPMDDREARRNAPNVHVGSDALIALRGHGDGYFRTGADPVPRLVKIDRISPRDPRPTQMQEDAANL